jgi:hypothetical protein
MVLFGNDRITMNYNEIVIEKQQHRQKILLFLSFKKYTSHVCLFVYSILLLLETYKIKTF